MLYRTADQINADIEEYIPEHVHYLKKMPKKDGKIVRRRCHGCYKKMRILEGTGVAARRTKQISTLCFACNKPFCMSCFNEYHAGCYSH